MRRGALLLSALALLGGEAQAFEWDKLTGRSSTRMHPAAQIKGCDTFDTPLLEIVVRNPSGCLTMELGPKEGDRRLMVLRSNGGELSVNGMPMDGSFTAWWWNDAKAPEELMVKVDAEVGAPQVLPEPIVTADVGGELNVNQRPTEVTLGDGMLKLRELGSEESATMFVGVDREGRRYAKIDSSIGLAPFEPNAGYTLQSNDRDGEPKDFRIQSSGMKWGSLKLTSFCLAYSQNVGLSCRGSDSTRFQNDDPPCGSDVGTWSGAGTFRLPGPAGAAKLDIGFWGAWEAGGSPIFFGGERAFGVEAPLAPGVFLDRIAAELCREPDWILRGELDLRFGPSNDGVWPFEEARFDGDFKHYPLTQAIEAKGRLHALGVTLGNAYFNYYPPGSVSFGGDAGISVGPDWANLSLNGRMDGFYESEREAAQLSGNVEVCVNGGGISVCRGGEAVVSTAGIGACFNFMTIDLGFYKIRIQAGAGYGWGGTPSIMVGSCGLGSWRVDRRRRTAARQAAGTLGFDVPAEEVGIGVRIRGTTAPPKVALVSPDGLRIIRTVEQGVTDGSHAVFFDGNDAVVMLAAPQAGRWSVQPHDDSPPVAGVDTADYDPPPAFDAAVQDKGTHELLTYRYAANPRHSIRLYEEGDENVHQDLGYPQGRRCADATEVPVREARELCGRLRFTPEPGPKGTRRIMAAVRDRETGTPISVVQVATFEAEAEERLPAPRPVAIERRGDSVEVSWPANQQAAAFEVEVHSNSDEQRLLEVDGDRTSVVIPGISRESVVAVRVYPVSDSGRDGLAALAREPGAPLPRDCQVQIAGAAPTGAQLKTTISDCAEQLGSR